MKLYIAEDGRVIDTLSGVELDVIAKSNAYDTILDVSKIAKTIQVLIQHMDNDEKHKSMILCTKLTQHLAEEDIIDYTSMSSFISGFLCGRLLGKFEKNTDCEFIMTTQQLSDEDKEKYTNKLPGLDSMLRNIFGPDEDLTDHLDNGGPGEDER